MFSLHIQTDLELRRLAAFKIKMFELFVRMKANLAVLFCFLCIRSLFVEVEIGK